MTPNASFWRRLTELYASRHEPEAVQPLATLVWRAILVFFLLGITGAVLYATMVFASVVDKVNTVPASTAPATALDRSALDQTIREIRERGVFLDIQ